MMDPLAPEVLEVTVKLLSSKELVTMFPLAKDRTICNMHGPKGMFACTRPFKHGGLHVAHTGPSECCAVWLNDLYHEYK